VIRTSRLARWPGIVPDCSQRQSKDRIALQWSA
jgi:hypothetical protein